MPKCQRAMADASNVSSSYTLSEIYIPPYPINAHTSNGLERYRNSLGIFLQYSRVLTISWDASMENDRLINVWSLNVDTFDKLYFFYTVRLKRQCLFIYCNWIDRMMIEEVVRLLPTCSLATSSPWLFNYRYSPLTTTFTLFNIMQSAN